MGPLTAVSRRTFAYWVCLKTTELCACLWESATKFWFFSLLCTSDCECKVIMYVYTTTIYCVRLIVPFFDLWRLSRVSDLLETSVRHAVYRIQLLHVPYIIIRVCLWVCAGLWIADQHTHTDSAGLLIVDQPYGSESQTMNDYVWCRGRRESAWQNASLCGAAILNYYTRDGILNE